MTTAALPFLPKALLFDLDGTLVDSEREVAAALDEILTAHGRPMSAQERLFVIGHGWGDIYRHLQQGAPVPLPLPALEDAVYHLRQQKLAAGGGVNELPGASALVQRASRQVPCALVTGSSRSEALMVLDALHITSCFTALSCAGESPRGKPAPDPYLHAAELLSIRPADCLALEDSLAGITSARAAGVFCIGITAGNFAGQDQSQADLLLGTLTEVDALLDWQ